MKQLQQIEQFLQIIIGFLFNNKNFSLIEITELSFMSTNIHKKIKNIIKNIIPGVHKSKIVSERDIKSVKVNLFHIDSKLKNIFLFDYFIKKGLDRKNYYSNDLKLLIQNIPISYIILLNNNYKIINDEKEKKIIFKMKMDNEKKMDNYYNYIMDTKILNYQNLEQMKNDLKNKYKEINKKIDNDNWFGIYCYLLKKTLIHYKRDFEYYSYKYNLQLTCLDKYSKIITLIEYLYSIELLY